MCVCKMPFSDAYLNILDLCRLCLGKDSNLLPVFDSTLDQFCDKINVCLAIQIKAEDRVTQKICSGCITKVNSFYEFRNTTSECQKVLHRWLTEANENQFNVEFSEDVSSPKDTDNLVKEELKSEQTTSEETDESENDCDSRNDYESSNFDDSDSLKEQKTSDAGVQPTTSRNVSVENEVPETSCLQTDQPSSSMKLQESFRHKISNTNEEKKCYNSKIKTHQPNQMQGDQNFKTIQKNFKSVTSSMPSVTSDVGNEAVLNDEKALKFSKDHVKKKFECNTCQFTAKYKSQLDIHIKRHMKEYTIFCDVCHKGFFYQNEIEVHKALHEDTNKFQCSICLKKFVYRHSLVSHTKKHSNISKPQDTFQCDKCGKKFSDKSYLKRHTEVHTGANKVICEVCGQVLCNRGALRSHKLTHTGERPFSCNTCGKAFSTKKYMIIHKRMHTGAKPFMCQICGKSFSQQSTLIVHKRYHSGERPYQCQMCDKGFVTKTILKLHQKNHTL